MLHLFTTCTAEHNDVWSDFHLYPYIRDFFSAGKCCCLVLAPPVGTGLVWGAMHYLGTVVVFAPLVKLCPFQISHQHRPDVIDSSANHSCHWGYTTHPQLYSSIWRQQLSWWWEIWKGQSSTKGENTYPHPWNQGNDQLWCHCNRCKSALMEMWMEPGSIY